MYGHTPPAVVCIDPGFVDDCTGMQQTAARLAGMLRRSPLHAVVRAPASWSAAPEEVRAMALESLRLEPGVVDADQADEEVARILAEHLERLGWSLRHGPVDAPSVEHAPRSHVWVGGPEEAAAVALVAGASEVVAWGAVPSPREMMGVRFVRDHERTVR